MSNLGFINHYPRFFYQLVMVLVAVLLAVSSSGLRQSALADNAPTRILVLGDSLVAGHALPQDKAFPEILQQALLQDGVVVSVINAGVSGDTTAGGLARLDWSLADNPDVAIIVLGEMICSADLILMPLIVISRQLLIDLRLKTLQFFWQECRHLAILVLIMSMHSIKFISGLQRVAILFSTHFSLMVWRWCRI